MLILGRGLTLRLIRDSPECDGLEQLKPIDQNLQYDFNFQQFVVLPKEVTVYPVRSLATAAKPTPRSQLQRDLGSGDN